MKKFVITLIAVCLLSTPTMARPHKYHHKPSSLKLIHHYKHNHSEPFVFAAAGLLGFTLGNIISYSSGQTNYTTNLNDRECFLVVSKSSGNVTQRCVDGNNQVLYVD